MKRCASSSDISVNGCKALGTFYYLPARKVCRRPARPVLLPFMLAKAPEVLGLLDKPVRRVNDYPRRRFVGCNENIGRLVTLHVLNTIEHKNKVASASPKPIGCPFLKNLVAVLTQDIRVSGARLNADVTLGVSPCRGPDTGTNVDNCSRFTYVSIQPHQIGDQ